MMETGEWPVFTLDDNEEQTEYLSGDLNIYCKYLDKLRRRTLAVTSVTM